MDNTGTDSTRTALKNLLKDIDINGLDKAVAGDSYDEEAKNSVNAVIALVKKLIKNLNDI